MALKFRVKAGNINNLSDARYCAGMGVEMLGFPVDPESDQSISPELFNAITGWVSGPILVGEITSETLPEDKLYEVSCFQVTQPHLIPDVKNMGMDVILTIDLKQTSFDAAEQVLRDNRDHVLYFLIENGGQAHIGKSEYDYLKVWAKKYPIMLGYGIGPDDLQTIEDLGISTIAINGSNEERPGFKSYDEMADILEKLEVE